MPKLSIITINLNNRAGLQKTMSSVLSQTFTDYEYIVIDGGSIDGSVDVIKEHEKKITYWVSEPDKGIYNAMNKGIARTTGDWVCFLNSGDQYFSESAVASAMDSTSFVKDVCPIYFFDYIYSKNDHSSFKISSEEVDNKSRIFIKGFGHPSTFYKRTMFSQIGLFDESFVISGDRELYLRAIIKYKLAYKYISISVSTFNEGGISTNSKYKELLQNEEKAIRKQYFSTSENILFGNRLFQNIMRVRIIHVMLSTVFNWKLPKSL